MTQPKTLEFHFDFGSPTSYLAYTQVPRIAAEAGATLRWHPMLLGGVFKATSNTSPVSVPAKGKYMKEHDMPRWAKHWGVPFALNPHFPINTLTLMRGACGMLLKQPADFKRYADAIFHAMWVEPRNLGDASELASVLSHASFDPTHFTTLVGDPDVKAALIANTEASVARGVFGAPTCFVGEQMFFGQDRLAFVREALG